jgi:hypothetical protein
MPDRDGVSSSRKSHYFYPHDDLRLRERMRAALPYEGYYTNMFFDDLQAVVPFSMGRSPEQQVRIEASDQRESARLITEALQGPRGWPGVSDAVRNFVVQSARFAAFAKSCDYEVVYFQSEDAERPTGFRLALIQPGTLDRVGGSLVQIVPRTLGDLVSPDGWNYVLLDQAQVVSITFPPAYQNPVGNLVSFLLAANAEQRREFSLMESSVLGRASYDFEEHKRRQSEAFARETSIIGWNVRGLHDRGQLEPFQAWRNLKFWQFKIAVRDAILDQLNAIFRHVGSSMGLDAQVSWIGLPGVRDVPVAYEDFESGKRGLVDLTRACI